MRGRAGIAVVVLLAGMPAAVAQAPRASSCAGGTASSTVREARASLERDPMALESRFKLADALTAQECYEDAVKVLEDGEALHPQSTTLEARLRSARSMISEQNYIESVTRAEEGARLQRNLLRCRKLADIAACDDALSVRRNDPELLAARAAAVAKGRGTAQPAVAALNEPAQTPAVQPARVPVVAAATAKPRIVVYSNDAPASRTN